MRSCVFLPSFSVAALWLAMATPALADGPFSVYIGPQFISQGTAQTIGGTVQTDVAAGYDFGPRTIVPVRAVVQLDDAFGSSANGRIGVFGAGVGVRLTTPVYAGIGVSFYNVNVTEDLRGLAEPFSRSLNGNGVGSNIFVGSRLFSAPGLSVSIEGSYKQIPSIGGVNPSAYGIGLRARI